MASIKQLQVAYSAHEDRLLVRLSTDDAHEFRAWLTRRAVAALWPKLQETLGRGAEVAAQASPQARNAVLSFKHEQAVAAAKFAERFESLPDAKLPLGPAPMLVNRMRVNPNGSGGLALSFYAEQGAGIDVSLGETLAHGFCRLLADATAKAQWSLDLKLADNITAVRREGSPVH